MERRFDKHIDDQELNVLVPWASESGQRLHCLSPQAIDEAMQHIKLCRNCLIKVSKYLQLVNGLSNSLVTEVAPPRADCPKDVDWHEVAAGLWPELKAKQLIMHAAFCNHCGPMLRAMTSVDDDPTPEETMLLAELRPPSRPVLIPQFVPPRRSPRRSMAWLVPVLALTAIIVMVRTRPLSSPKVFSGVEFAEFAVNTHRRHAQGKLALDIHSDSQQTLNEWLEAKSPVTLAMPAPPAAPAEERPYRLEGARLVPAGGKTAVYIAYQMQTGPVSLMVASDSVAAASGGVEANFKKLTFHYLTVEGYKVVTWSLHRNTYALVSQEGNNTQRSCMICHSVMRDRDLSQTPTPLGAEEETVRPALQ